MEYGEFTEDPNSPTGYLIPNNIGEALLELERILGERGKQEVMDASENDMCQYHHGLGTQLRNEWGLWCNGSPLSEYFNKIGITHPDDMTGIIFNTYWRLRHDKFLDIEGQVKYYQEFWKQSLSSNGTFTISVKKDNDRSLVITSEDGYIITTKSE